MSKAYSRSGSCYRSRKADPEPRSLEACLGPPKDALSTYPFHVLAPLPKLRFDASNNNRTKPERLEASECSLGASGLDAGASTMPKTSFCASETILTPAGFQSPTATRVDTCIRAKTGIENPEQRKSSPWVCRRLERGQAEALQFPSKLGLHERPGQIRKKKDASLFHWKFLSARLLEQKKKMQIARSNDAQQKIRPARTQLLASRPSNLLDKRTLLKRAPADRSQPSKKYPYSLRCRQGFKLDHGEAIEGYFRQPDSSKKQAELTLEKSESGSASEPKPKRPAAKCSISKLAQLRLRRRFKKTNLSMNMANLHRGQNFLSRRPQFPSLLYEPEEGPSQEPDPADITLEEDASNWVTRSIERRIQEANSSSRLPNGFPSRTVSFLDESSQTLWRNKNGQFEQATKADDPIAVPSYFIQLPSNNRIQVAMLDDNESQESLDFENQDFESEQVDTKPVHLENLEEPVLSEEQINEIRISMGNLASPRSKQSQLSLEIEDFREASTRHQTLEKQRLVDRMGWPMESEEQNRKPRSRIELRPIRALKFEEEEGEDEQAFDHFPHFPSELPATSTDIKPHSSNVMEHDQRTMKIPVKPETKSWEPKGTSFDFLLFGHCSSEGEAESED